VRKIANFITSLFCLACQTAYAEDREVVVVKIGCFTGSQEQLEVLKRSRLGMRGCRESCSGCGCRGGPGYRDKNGACVSYSNLISICSEDFSNCKQECAETELICIKPSQKITDTIENGAIAKVECDRLGEATVKGPRGECVAQEEIKSVCGVPPTKRCTISLPSLK